MNFAAIDSDSNSKALKLAEDYLKTLSQRVKREEDSKMNAETMQPWAHLGMKYGEISKCWIEINWIPFDCSETEFFVVFFVVATQVMVPMMFEAIPIMFPYLG